MADLSSENRMENLKPSFWSQKEKPIEKKLGEYEEGWAVKETV